MTPFRKILLKAWNLELGRLDNGRLFALIMNRVRLFRKTWRPYNSDFFLPLRKFEEVYLITNLK